MHQRETHEKLHHTAGYATWLLVTGLATYIAVINPERYLDGLPAMLVFAAINLVATWQVLRAATSPGIKLAALWLQLASAFAMALAMPFSFLAIYTIIWLSMSSHFYSLRTCWMLLVGIVVAWYLIADLVWQHADALLSTLLYGTFHMFALISSSSARQADVARQEVESLNRELQATQHLLTEASRFQERTRIARDLHDLLGHHLTALSINLQIAERQADDEAKPRLQECRQLARLLLSDVREAVSELREDSSIDFSRAVQMIVDGTPELVIELDIEEDLEIHDVAVAETLLRCVQEAITNTLRHSGARNSWVRIYRDDSGLQLQVHDDGRPPSTLTEGKGLTGMRERLQQLKGTLTLDNTGPGLRLHASIPAADASV